VSVDGPMLAGGPAWRLAPMPSTRSAWATLMTFTESLARRLLNGDDVPFSEIGET
jgi:hypothetical protein